jgi:hypothetical protein
MIETGITKARIAHGNEGFLVSEFIQPSFFGSVAKSRRGEHNHEKRVSLPSFRQRLLLLITLCLIRMPSKEAGPLPMQRPGDLFHLAAFNEESD